MANKAEINNDEQPDYVGHRKRLKARFMADEGASMPDYELLELILTYAIPRSDVKPLAKQLIKKYTCLANVLATPAVELMEFAGVGYNTAALFAVIHSCCNKICWENLENNDELFLGDKNKIAEFCRSCIGYSDSEKLLIIYLNVHGRYINHSIEGTGTIDRVQISPREVLKRALMYHAAGIIISHNHPSGSCCPSSADIRMTQDLKKTLDMVKIKLLDHIIISKSDYFSFYDQLPILRH